MIRLPYQLAIYLISTSFTWKTNLSLGEKLLTLCDMRNILIIQQ